MMKLYLLGWTAGALIAGVIGANTLSTPGQSRVARIATVEGFQVPESARYDPEQDLYFVSNVTGHPAEADDDGFISVMEPDGRIRTLRWIDGRASAITLHAPKGMAIVGDALWVADITVVRSFNRRTGAPGPVIDLTSLGARFLNDVAAGPDGQLFVSDTGLVFENGRGRLSGPQRVYEVPLSGAPSVLVEDPRLRAPNGVYFDAVEQRLLVASLSGTEVFAVDRTGTLTVAATGPGGYDGLERLPDGRILVSSQDGESVLAIAGGAMVPIITNVSEVGDLGVDTRRSRVAIPRLDTNLLEIWEVR